MKRRQRNKYKSKTSHEITRETLQQLFKKSADITFQDYYFQNHKVTFVTCESMVDEQLLYQVIIEKVEAFFKSEKKLNKEDIRNYLHLPELQEIKNKDDAITMVYSGYVLLYFEDDQMLFASNITNKPNRQPEETKTEVSIKGPRDNFIEDISVNIALVRKRMPTNSLCVEKTTVGKRTKTNVALLYMDDIANKTILNGIRNKLEQIDVDIVFSPNLLMEYIDKSSRLFPRHDYTGRPDLAIQALVRGRVVILVDGGSYATILPVNLFLLFKTIEDNEYPTLYGSFERLLRIIGVLLGTLLPAFWLALTTFHQDQLPLLLLAKVVESRTGLPLPSFLEMLIMLIMFELFREAGLRLPEAIGGTLSVVGGLIIGDAAIRSGITSPSMVVVIATSTVATFTLLNQSFVGAVSLLRFSSIIATAIFGLFGFFMSLFFTILYLANIRIFGVPYMNIAANLSWNKVKHTIFRPLQKDYKKRPESLKPIDDTRISEKYE